MRDSVPIRLIPAHLINLRTIQLPFGLDRGRHCLHSLEPPHRKPIAVRIAPQQLRLHNHRQAAPQVSHLDGPSSVARASHVSTGSSLGDQASPSSVPTRVAFPRHNRRLIQLCANSGHLKRKQSGCDPAHSSHAFDNLRRDAVSFCERSVAPRRPTTL